MGGGVILGVFWGLVLSVVVAALVSLSSPLPTDADGQAATETTAQIPALAALQPSDEMADDADAADALAEDPAPVAAGAAAPEPEPEAEPQASPAADAADVADAAPEAPEGSTQAASATATDQIPLPSGSEFNRPPPEEAAIVPQTDTAPTDRAPSTPAAQDAAQAGGIDTAPPPAPDVAAAPLAQAPAPAAPTDLSALSLPQAGPAPAGQRPQLRPLATPDRSAEPTPDAQSAPEPVSEPLPSPEAAPEIIEDAPEVADIPQAAPLTQQVTEAEDASPILEEPAAVSNDAATETADIAAADAPAADGETPAAPQPAETAGAAVPETGGAPNAPDPVAQQTEDDAPEADREPPVVVRLVPPRESAPLGTPPVSDPTAGAAAPEASMETAAAPEPPRILRPSASQDDDAATSTRVLPQIVSPGRSEAPADLPDADEAPEAAEGEAAPGDAPASALEAYSVPFEPVGASALISVILIDEPDARLDISTLTGFDIPVAFAVDPARDDAAERAAAFRAAGFEVLMLGTVIPEGANGADTEIALGAARPRVPEAIALMDTPDSRIQSDRAVLEAVVGAAAGEGQGLIAFPRGLNTAEQTAARQGVPAATLFRLLDDEDQRATVITRFLGRAEFAAVQEGAVVVAGHTRPDTVTALFSWALGSRNEGVVIAPLSATLRRLAEDG